MTPQPRGVNRLVEDQIRRWLEEQRARAKARPTAMAHPIVTLSRQAGSGGTELGRLVAARLGFDLWDQELVQRVAAQAGAPDRLVAVVDERDLNVAEGVVAAVLMGDAVSGEAYVERLGRLVRAISKRGNAVVVGRGAQFLLDPGEVLRVRAVGPMEARVRRLMADEHLAEREARAKVERLDRERLTFVRHHHHTDAASPDLYDLVVNTAALSIEQATDIVVGAYHAKFGSPPNRPPSAMNP